MSEVVLTSKCVYKISLCLHSCSFQKLVMARSVGALTFCSWSKWQLFLYCRSHLSCCTSVLYSLWSVHCFRVIF